MPDEPKPYVIQKGDTLLTIALSHEVDKELIWEHEKNAEMKEARDPEILAPGEVIFIPPPEESTLQVSPQSTNSFTAKVPMVDLHFQFKGEEGELSGEEYVVTGLDEPIEDKLDGEGKLKLTVPAFTQKLKISFPELEVEHDIWVGHLDPVDRSSGMQARLLHLAHLPIDKDSIDPFIFVSKVTERDTLLGFQKAFGLDETGYFDPDTGDALTKAHGS